MASSTKGLASKNSCVLLKVLRTWGAFIFLIPSSLSAQVAVTANMPAYHFQVLAGSTRQINVQITSGGVQCTQPAHMCTINWAVASSTGGASATFTDPKNKQVSSISGALPTMQVNIGPTAGTCSISGSAGAYGVSSTATVVVQAQSTDDTAKSASFLFNVCANTTRVLVAPAYQQAYRGQPMTLQSWVAGNTDETGTWSIESQPSGGDGRLADTENRDTVFAASVTGRYQLAYTSHANANQSGTSIVYVSPNPMPPYTSTPNQTKPHECYRDPALTGPDYEVGAGKAYATISSVPAIASWIPGTIMRIWNTDKTGSSPSAYREYFQVKKSGTATQPVIVCGVSDSAGNLPILDGANAVGQSGISTGAAAGYGILTLWGGSPTPYGYWQSGSAGPSYVSITGLHLRNATPANSYTPPGGGAAIPYVKGASCINLRGGSYIDVSGNDMDTCTNGLFTAENANSAWANITQQVTVSGNHIHGSGWVNDYSEHQVYFQSFYGLMEGNRIDNYLSSAAGSNIKWRGVEGIFRYNYVGGQAAGAAGPLRDFDLVENQDAASYVSFESYLANSSLYFYGDKAGADIIAGYQESAQKDFVYGNLIFPAGSQQIHYAADNVGGMTNRNGVLYFYSNTMPGAKQVFDTGENGDGFNPYLQQRVDARNNIFWASPGIPGVWASGTMVLNEYQTLILNAATNLFKTGTMSISTPIAGIRYGNGNATGWGGGCDANPCLWPLSSPIDTHVYGLNSSNFLLTSTQPFDTATMIPPPGSAAIDGGTELSGEIATLPVRWQYSIATSSLIPRADPLTIGAEDPAAGTAVPTFTPAAGQYASTQTVIIRSSTPSATIYYTVNGSTPTTGSTVYSGPISVSTSERLQAIAVAPGRLASAPGSAAYIIGTPAAKPMFSPAGGVYTSAQKVSISTTTASAAIYYTIDGSDPTNSPSAARYTASISVSGTITLNAMVKATGYSNSAVGSATYIINLPAAATPTFSISGGTYNSTQTVAMGTITGGAAIYYTTDGSNPASSSSASLYKGPLMVSSSETIKVVAIAAGYSPSAIGSSTFTIKLPFGGPVFVQQCNQFVQYGMTATCTLTQVGAGHTLVIGIGGTGTIGVPPTLSLGRAILAVTDNNLLSAYIVPNTAAGSVTVKFGYSGYRRLWLSVSEYANTAAAPLDGVASRVFPGWAPTALTTPALNTTSNSELIWSFSAAPAGYTLAPGAGPLGWTKRPTPTGSGYATLIEDGQTTSPGAYLAQSTGPAASYNIIALALKPPK